ncbi:hypothetical protein K461DRAFT_277030 [Myriangium duriaei CBS 260.36]|uniref:Uncharacterized protein n=1 Tax=Myriangium duriaei CBS 260.36 TaxID=1168546 RepID=A0A9P4J1X3_9PEZI|nr:hypothetical protein K461DRAFT_277030 [Myriangium duriaei CBS 260.36]
MAAPNLYQASLGPVPEQYKAGHYAVGLRPGHTLDMHFRAIGCDLTAYMKRPILIFPDGSGAVYFVHSIDDNLLTIIRSDPGVEHVEYQNARSGRLIEPVERGTKLYYMDPDDARRRRRRDPREKKRGCNMQ